MSRGAVSQVIQRAIGDATFRRQLTSDPTKALAGFDLSKDERAAITSGDPGRLTALGVDQRMSKAFGLSGVASKSAAVDDIGGGSSGASAVVDETTGGNAFQQNLRRIEGDLDTASRSAIRDAHDAAAYSATGTETNAFQQNLRRIEGDLDTGSGSAIRDAHDTTASSARQPVDVSGDFNRLDAGIETKTPEATAFEPGTSGLDLGMIDPGYVSGGDAAAPTTDVVNDAQTDGFLPKELTE